MTDLKKLTAKQTAHYGYMMDVMARLEWDLHNTIELTGRIPPEWHVIARATPTRPKLKINLLLEEDVVKFFKSMGEGYGARINAVLKSYMHARLAGVIKGAETVAHFRRRDSEHEGGKPGFGTTAAQMGWDWSDDGPEAEAAHKARLLEALQRRYAAEGLPERDEDDWPRL